MIAKKRLALAAAAVLLTFVGHQLAFWRGSGNLFDVIAGQFEPRVTTDRRDVSLRGETESYSVQVRVDVSQPIHRVAEEYLSFSIDTSQIVGGKWWSPSAEGRELGSGKVPAPVFDFDRSQLDLLTSALAPAYLRIGGSEADRTYYALDDGNDGAMPDGAIPDGYESVLSRPAWDRICAFARRNGLSLIFTLNAGPSSRGQDGAWQSNNAAELIEYSARQACPVDVWELGNELNIFWYHYGPWNQVSARQYARDLERLRTIVQQHMPQARIGGQGAAFWPILGEPVAFLFGFTSAYLRSAGDIVDLVNWHYYPQQSRRAPVAVRRASPSRMLEPAHLDEAGHWARKLRQWRDSYAPRKPIWLGESGNAQAGGEPGVSDVYISGLWWLDQLGLLAVHGHDVVVRQTLSGLDYGMIETATLEPRPDYWNSVLWKRLMGPDVYAVEVVGEDRLRGYAHSGATDDSVSMLLINLDPARSVRVEFLGFDRRRRTLYEMQTSDVLGSEVWLNGRPLELSPGSVPSDIVGRADESPAIIVRPLAYTFVVWNSGIS